MSQRQITELPTATTPDGSELLLVRQDLFDKKLDVNSLLAYLQSVLDDRYLNESLNLSDVDAVQTAFDNIKQVATESYTGVVELATVAEAIAGVDTTRAVTPEGLFEAILQNVPQATYTAAGKVELATDEETNNGVDTTRATTPSGVDYAIGQRLVSFKTALTTEYDTRFLNESSNLSDLPNKATARTNLAVYSKSDTDNKYAHRANNLSDLSNKSSAFNTIKQQASSTYAGVVELATGSEVVAGTRSDLAVTPLAIQELIDTIMCGQVSAFAMGSPPTGWLKCNGAAVSRTTYAKLFAKIGTRYGAGNGSTTFNLPDLRGEFVRGFDDGRGVDIGRILGTWQVDTSNHLKQVRSYRGNPKTYSGNTITVPESGAESAALITGGIDGDSDNINYRHHYKNSGDESKPRNVALLYCIKY